MPQNLWPDSFVEVNGISLHYHQTAPGKPVVVLLHGLTDNGLCWGRLAEKLEADYTLLMVDARGHGRSGASPAGEYGVEHHAADVIGLVKALGLSKPVLMGHSMGGASAALAEAMSPGLARALVLEDPAWQDTAPSAEAAEGFAHWQAELARAKTATRAQVAALGRKQNPTWHPDEFDAWAESTQQFEPEAFTFMRRPARAWREVAAALTCPVLLATGEPDRGSVVTSVVAEAAARLVPFLRVVNFPTGHNIRREAFEPFAAAVSAFLAQLPD